MAAAREAVVSCLSEQEWKRFAELETLHHAVQASHERVLRTLDEAIKTDRADLMIAWNQYRAVVADLSLVSERIESLRLMLR
ncbi:MAG TPA: hypothetical protein VMI92_11130 [Steroidobacteraceae bacterium]|nr:hypothetical protein [Steroidobacteraceae bacterium]